MNTINRNQLVKLIKSTNGRFFTAIFTKKNGEDRIMNCRLGVTKNLTGKGMSYNPRDYDMISVFDVKADGYRLINLRKLKALQINGEVFTVLN